MSNVAIRVEHLSKRYQLGQRVRYKTLRESLSKLVNFKAAGANESKSKPGKNEFWALDDVSFDVNRGEVLGIIGRNGAGKSTLLKVLSQITEPTRGRIEITGRVGSLLEVGTGFHPELTGRENVFLNGSILGMRRWEIAAKFDEIVAFAEVERFLDTPVKHYSSGMYTRLAFAVAAHLEPEILIVDEVLAVGDREFQDKCMGKMSEVAGEGRTVLFVSHNLGAVSTLCQRGIVLTNGHVTAIGTAEEALAVYLQRAENDEQWAEDVSDPAANQKLKIRQLRLLDEHGEQVIEANTRSPVFIEVRFDVLHEGHGYYVGLELHQSGVGCVFCSASFDDDPQRLLKHRWKRGRYQARLRLPTDLLRGGEYWIRAASAIPAVEILDVFQPEPSFRVIDLTSPVALSGEGRRGCILPVIPWRIESN